MLGVLGGVGVGAGIDCIWLIGFKVFTLGLACIWSALYISGNLSTAIIRLMYAFGTKIVHTVKNSALNKHLSPGLPFSAL